MTRTLSPVTKARQRTYPGSIRLDERPRNPLPRSPILIAPRPFAYDALQPGEIRLIDLSPSQDRSTPIRAILRHGPLRSRTYVALSCMWGSEEPRATIHVNGQPLTISDSLLEALRDLRSETNNKTLWIDSICINQNDRKETGDQLGRMTEILRHATGVIPWIWDKNGKRYALDDTMLNPWLVSGRTLSPPTRNSALPQIGDIESEHSFNITGCQAYFESPPALISSPGSPQTNSASTSPDTSANFHFQTTSSLESHPFHFGCSDSWTVNMDDSGFHQLSLDGEVMTKMANTSKRKRSLVTAFPNDLPAPCNQKIQQTQSISADGNERESSVVFACPFQKSNPQKYHRCLKYTLTRIKDVKQHIYRQHTQPPFYCARCYKVFNSTGDRDEHSRRADCEKRSPPQFEGISELQRNELKKSSPKKRPLQEQWFEVWDVVFPNSQRPQSALIGNYVEEMVTLLRDIWNKKKAEIISDVIDSRSGRDGVDSGLLADIMGSVFDRFEAETTRSSQLSSTERTGSPDILPLRYTAQKESDFCFELEAALDQQDLPQMVGSDFDTGCVVDLENYYFSQSL